MCLKYVSEPFCNDVSFRQIKIGTATTSNVATMTLLLKQLKRGEKSARARARGRKRKREGKGREGGEKCESKIERERGNASHRIKMPQLFISSNRRRESTSSPVAQSAAHGTYRAVLLQSHAGVVSSTLTWGKNFYHPFS